MQNPFVGIQINATSFMDEGIDAVLDELETRANVNALLLANPAWSRGVGGRVTPGHPLPDHGVQEYDLNWWGGNYARSQPQYYGGTMLSQPPSAPEYPDFDFLAEVMPRAAERGMASYLWVDESSFMQAIRDIPNMPKCLERDVWSRPGLRPCFNNEHYRNWWLSIIEDLVKSYPLEGLIFCSERQGPLNTQFQGKIRPEALTCFCPSCQDIARNRGIDVHRAIKGYRELLVWNNAVADGGRPVDGAFVTFWRLLLQYPEILAWQTLWTDSQQQFFRDIYGVAKASRPTVQIGWHIYHNNSLNPFFRATQDYGAYSEFSDFLKLVAYNNAAGPRFRAFIDSITKTVFADIAPGDAYTIITKFLGYEEAGYDNIRSEGFSAQYVKRETERAVKGTHDVKIFTGIDIDIPVGSNPQAVADRALRFEGNMGTDRSLTAQGWEVGEGDLAECTPESVRAAVIGAFEGGAEGIVLSRKYSEMRLDNLSAVGAALSDLKRLNP